MNGRENLSETNHLFNVNKKAKICQRTKQIIPQHPNQKY